MSCEDFIRDESTNPISGISTLFDQIAVDPDRAFGLSATQIAALLIKCAAEEAKLSSIREGLAAALVSSGQSCQSSSGLRTESRLLTVDEAAAKLSVKPGWLYRRGKGLGLAAKLSDGTLRFSNVALEAYIKEQTIPAASAPPVRRRRKAEIYHHLTD